MFSLQQLKLGVSEPETYNPHGREMADPTSTSSLANNSSSSLRELTHVGKALTIHSLVVLPSTADRCHGDDYLLGSWMHPLLVSDPANHLLVGSSSFFYLNLNTDGKWLS